MSEFGNYGNYGDGGYNLSQGGGFDNNSSSSQQRHGGGGQVRSSLTPVTIKQINDLIQPTPDGEFKIFNVELNMISFIGIIRKVTIHQSAIILTIEDGSGSIEVRKWIDEGLTTINEENEKYESWLNKKYVFVGGALKQFNNKKTIQNALIYSIDDSNQIIYHHLSAIEHHLKSQGIPKHTTKNESNNNQNQLFVDNVNPNSISTIDKVLQVLKDNSSTMSEGVPLSYVVQKLNISKDEAKKHCDEMIESGKIYTGFDDNTYIAI